MTAHQALQIIQVPHRPVKSDAEIGADLDPAFKILLSAKGLTAAWQGTKYEERFTRVYLLLWTDLASSHAFFTSPDYAEFHKVIQPALNGRRIAWTQHALVGTSSLDDVARLRSIVASPAIEVALTKVVEGGVAGYYERFEGVVGPILDAEPGCHGWFIGPQMENPQHQVLLIHWDSVDAHHEDFEKRPTFQQCIDALSAYYAEFVTPTHIVGLKPIFGSL